MIKRQYSILFLCCFLSAIVFVACSKEKIQLSAVQIQSPITSDWNKVLYINDSIGFICGGNKYAHGYVLVTRDAGNHWDTSFASAPKALYTMVFMNQKLYCTGYDGFYFMSADSGRTWVEWNYPQYKRFNQIFFANNQKVFAAVGEGFDNGTIYQSNDEGLSWSRKDTFVKVIKSLYFIDEQVGFAGSYGSIYKTIDGGNSWQPTTADGDFFVKIEFCTPTIGYAIGYFGKILKTTDAGNHWKKILNENFQFNEKSNFNDACFVNDKKCIVVGNKGYMIQTLDGGESWQSIEKFTQEDLVSVAMNNGVLTTVGSNGVIFKLAL
jgi:photosystem II stability/assembly factor-like uncharacterized protein